MFGFQGKAVPDPFLIEIESYPDQETLIQVRKDLAMVLLHAASSPTYSSWYCIRKGISGSLPSKSQRALTA